MRVNDTGAPSEWNAVAHRPCRPGRHGAIGHGTTKSRDEHGSPSNPLFLLNHWLHRSPPDPGAAGAANAKAVLKSRIDSCQQQRHLLPNVIAVDFASRGDLISVAGDVDDRLRGRGPQGASTGAGGATSSAPPSSAPPSTPTSEATPGADLPDLPGPQLITSLTGGDPAAFCATEPQTLTDIGAFAAAALTETGGQVGTADLVFAPTLVRALGSTMASAQPRCWRASGPCDSGPRRPSPPWPPTAWAATSSTISPTGRPLRWPIRPLIRSPWASS